MFYKAIKEGLVIPERSVQVGIRTTNTDTMDVDDAASLQDSPLNDSVPSEEAGETRRSERLKNKKTL